MMLIVTGVQGEGRGVKWGRQGVRWEVEGGLVMPSALPDFGTNIKKRTWGENKRSWTNRGVRQKDAERRRSQSRDAGLVEWCKMFSWLTISTCLLNDFSFIFISSCERLFVFCIDIVSCDFIYFFLSIFGTLKARKSIKPLGWIIKTKLRWNNPF